MSFYLAPSSTLLINYLISSALEALILVPIILVIQRLSGERLSPTAKHALWFILLLRLSIPEFPESRLSLFWYQGDQMQHAIQNPHSTTKPPRFQALKDSVYGPSTQTEREPIEASENPPLVNKSSLPAAPNDKPHGVPSNPTRDRRGTLLTATQSQDTFEYDASKATSSDRALIPWISMALVLWLGGVVLIVFRILQKWTLFLRKFANARQLEQTPELQCIYNLQEKLGLKRLVRIYETDSVTSPATYGLFSPKILLPRRFRDNNTPLEVSHVLIHELAHIKRRDALWNLWTTAIQILHWPNPIVWYAVNRMRGDRELATDFLALRTEERMCPAAYGETILKTVQSIPKQLLGPGLIGIAEDRHSLRRRINMISRFQNKRRDSTAAMIAVFTGLSMSCLTDIPVTQLDPDIAIAEVGDKASRNTLSIRPQHVIKVLVTDAETGLSIPGAVVDSHYANGRNDITNSKEFTDESGVAFVRIPKPLGLPELETFFNLKTHCSNGYVSQSHPWWYSDAKWELLPESHEFKLSKGIEIGGIVEDENNKPIPGVSLQLSGFTQTWNESPTTENLSQLFAPFSMGITTDRNGRWTCQGVPDSANLFQITLRKPNGATRDFSTARYQQIPLTRPSESQIYATALRDKSCRLRFSSGNHIKVSVRDSHGQPIHGAEIQEVTGSISRTFGASLFTNEDGIARFLDLDRNAREIAFIASHKEFAAAQKIAYPGGGQTAVTFVLHPSERLEGIIVNEAGQAIPGALIDLAKDPTVTWFLTGERRPMSMENSVGKTHQAPRYSTRFALMTMLLEFSKQLPKIPHFGSPCIARHQTVLNRRFM